MDFIKQIEENNKSHGVDRKELLELIEQAKAVFKKHQENSVNFERSVFINWTCAIADCKYCYLSTRPKLDKKALRSPESILAEILVCLAMKWDIGYITGGLRVEPNEYLTTLMQNCNKLLSKKVSMNFGPYHEKEILAFKPFIGGMGSAIESFDEQLHNYICPSKPLKSLLRTLEVLKREQIPSFITIILGMGEKKSDVKVVIEKIKEYDISKVQLCFLKPQDDTIFFEASPPSPDYMAWWIAKLRIAHPQLKINVALVRERINDLALYLNAGANNFTRFLVFKDFNSEYAIQLESACEQAKRDLVGHFTSMPSIDVKKAVAESSLDTAMKEKVLPKALQYVEKLEKLGK